MRVTFHAAGKHADPAISELELDVHQVDAARILSALGYLGPHVAEDIAVLHDAPPDEFPELTGETDAEQFLGTVLLAIALGPRDPGRPSLNEKRWYEVEIADGYVDDRLPRLARLARYCLDTGRAVAWG